MPRVSVIIPAHNAEAHIEEALRSVAAQGYDDWEAIVADDRSTDATAEIASRFAGVSVVPVTGPRGPAGARNAAIATAGGELLAFLDADDYWLPEYLEHQVALFDENGGAEAGVGIVACDAKLLLPNGSFARETHAEIAGFPDRVTVRRLLESNPIFVSALVPRAVVNAVGSFSTRTFGSEDHDLWLKIVERGHTVVATRRPLAVYRFSGDSVSRDLAGMARTGQATYRLALERGNLRPPERRLAKRQLRLQQAVEVVESHPVRRGERGLLRSWVALARAGAVFLAFAVRHPRRWPRWVSLLRRGETRLWRPPML